MGRQDHHRLALLAVLCAWASFQGYAVSDFQWTFSTVDLTAFLISNVSSPLVYGGQLNDANPTVELLLGKRYEVTIVNSSIHLFQVVAKGATDATDVVLLSQGGTVGMLESDPGVAWTDDGASANGKLTFTVTQALVNAMRAASHTPGYRCGLHTDAMRGNFLLLGEPILDPIPEPLPKGTIAIELQTVAEGLASPLGVAFAPASPARMYVYDQVGLVRLVDLGVLQPTPFLDVSARLVSLNPGYDERGLLGFALHPDFPTTHKVYTYTSEPVSGPADFTVTLSSGSFNHQSVVAEWSLSANPDLVDVSSRREILRIDQPQSNHNAGTMRFGLDQLLYIALGDGGSADDEGNGHGTSGNGQDKSTILGSVIRIDVSGGGTLSANGQYGIPASNPFQAGPIREMYAYGFRNPFAFSFDSLDGSLYLGDVGQNNIEEVDVVLAGRNYGWNLKEGTFFFNPAGSSPGYVTDTPLVDPLPADLDDPIAQYDHDEGLAIVGGFVYRGTAFPELEGIYVTGDLGNSFSQPSGRLFYVDDANAFNEFQIGIDDRAFGYWLKGFGQDPAGEVYICASKQLGPSGTLGAVLKIIPVQHDPRDIDVNGDIDAVDVQLVINAALDIDIGGWIADVDGVGGVNAVDIQIVINGALGLGA